MPHCHAATIDTLASGLESAERGFLPLVSKPFSVHSLAALNAAILVRRVRVRYCPILDVHHMALKVVQKSP
jgi:hypothetical protein